MIYKFFFIIISTYCISGQFISGQTHNLQFKDNNDYQNAQIKTMSPQDPRFDRGASEFVSQTIMNLAYKIGHELNTNNLTGTYIFSPASIASALSLVMLGANGKTFQELMQLFGYDQNSYFSSYPFKIHEEFGFLIEDLIADSLIPSRYRPNVLWKTTQKIESLRGDEPDVYNNQPVSSYHQIHIANGIFMKNGYSLRPDYVNTAQGIYKSDITQLDFAHNPTAAKNYINNWVNQNTHNKIPNILSKELPIDTQVVLGSALYFKSLWDKKFFKFATSVNDFYPDGLNAPSIKVQTMINIGVFPFYDGNDCDCSIIGLPYKGGLSTMYIIQPKDSTRQKLSQFQYYLTPQKIEELIEKMTRKNVMLFLPKLHITNSFNLKNLFLQLGQISLFSMQNSDLSLMTDSFQSNKTSDKAIDPYDSLRTLDDLRKSQHLERPSLYFNEVIHKVDLVVNEDGTEGAAATLISFKKSGPEVTMRANTPFLILVRHDTTKIPLFYGPVYDPSNN